MIKRHSKPIRKRIMDFMYAQRTADGDSRSYSVLSMNQVVGAAYYADVHDRCWELVRGQQLVSTSRILLHSDDTWRHCFRLSYRAWLLWTIKQRADKEKQARQKVGEPLLVGGDIEL